MSLTIPFAVVLSVMIGVSGCRCPISSRAVQSSSTSHEFAYSAPLLASAADAMTVLISSQMLWTGPLSKTLVSSGFSELAGLELRKKCLLALLLACGVLK
eukprot:8998489-Ditylum_brightwellii.AAC.1